MDPKQNSGNNNEADLPVIEGYDAFEPLGRGDGCLIWKARQIASGMPVTVRVFAKQPANPERLQADLELACRLRHENIVKALGFGRMQATGWWYVVSEHVPGYSLQTWLERSGNLSEANAQIILHFAADALGYAWSKFRLTHGCLSPASIIVAEDGSIRLDGLGLAQILPSVRRGADEKQLVYAYYLAPELLADQSGPNCRSDIYALGAVLLCALTGELPAGAYEEAARSRALQVEALLNGKPVTSPGLTIGAARLIAKMMACDPAQRYQKWDEALRDVISLERAEVQSSRHATATAVAEKKAEAQAAAIKQENVKSTPGVRRAARPGGVKRLELPNLKRPVYSLRKSARRSFYIAVAFHLLLLLAAGTIIISRAFYNRETNFVGQPPPMKSFEPRKLEHKVKVQKRQRSSSRPSMTPRLVATKSSSFALPEIKVDSKSVKTSFAPKFSTVSGVGMGVGLGMGYGLGGFGTGVSEYNFFGIKGRADRVVILLDVSESMVEDIRDGEKGYQRVKDKIGEVIDALAEQALFNVIVFADAASAYSTNLIVASAENKRQVKKWISPFNSKNNYGLATGNLQPSALGLRAYGGTTRLDLALTGAFMQGADTILVISDGLPQVKKELTEQQKEAWDERVMQWERENAATLKAREKAIAYAETRGNYTDKKVWVPGTKRKEGQAAREGHYATRRVWHHGNLPALTPRPVPPDHLLWWTLNDFIEHFTVLYKELYEKKGGKKAPVIHCIGYCIDDEGNDFLKGLAKYFKGNYRRVGGRAKSDGTDKKNVKYPSAARFKSVSGKAK